MSNDRVIELEYKIAEQELSSSKLSEELYHQQLRIDKLEQHIKVLLEHMKGEQHQGDNEVPIDQPPHY